MTRCADPSVVNGFQNPENSRGQADLLAILFINELQIHPKQTMYRSLKTRSVEGIPLQDILLTST